MSREERTLKDWEPSGKCQYDHCDGTRFSYDAGEVPGQGVYYCVKCYGAQLPLIPAQKDALLIAHDAAPQSDAALRDQGATIQEQEEDFGAGLIHQTIPDVEGTEPRLNSVLAEFIEDPYASGRFENLGCQGLPEDVYNELLRVAADKHVSVYYLAAIYKRGQADALASIEDQDSYLWERCYKCGHRLAFASDSCPQCGVHFVDGDDPPNWPEKCQCDRCMEARTNEQD